jgi:hypothetical protein
MLSQRGIEANPQKIRAILDMEAPKNIKDVQKLNGRITSLGRKLLRARSAERSLPFFKILKKGTEFQWSAECQKA